MAQIAGRVAILPKGKWENNVTYSKLDLVYYKNASYVARKASTNVIPADDTETWMLVLKGIDEQLIDDIISGTTPVGNSASLGGETAEAWQNKLDNIQTISSGELSQSGWYRVAEYVGASAETCTLQIFRPWYYNQGEMHTLHYEYVNPLSPVIKSLSDMSSDHLITKSRITTDGTKKYFEIYYISSNANDVGITLLQGKPYDKSWQAITPTPTEETIEGVTITTTYDIPANASPVTDLDLAEHVYPYKSAGTESAINEMYDNYSANMPNNTTYEATTNHTISHSVLGGGTFKLEGFKANSNYEWQTLQTYAYAMFFRHKTAGVWGGWQTYATTADLANYLLLSGGDITGNLQFVNSSGENVYGLQRTSLVYGLYSHILSKWLIEANVDGTGTPTFNGVASENLALTNSSPPVIKTASSDVLQLRNTSGSVSVIHYFNSSGDMGCLGFTEANKPVFSTTGGVNMPLLHKGNSVAVAVTASAPSDTAALWYDTVNKMLKRYVDGAWQQ